MMQPPEIVLALYRSFFERGVRYFFPGSSLEVTGHSDEIKSILTIEALTDGSVYLEWMRARYHFVCSGRPLTQEQLRLMGAVGSVLSLRFSSIFSGGSPATTPPIFEGLAEDRYVSAFLDPSPYLSNNGRLASPDVAASAIEVLRESSLLTYENRRISTGVVLIGTDPDPYHRRPQMPEGAQTYDSSLVSIKSFQRLCDGLQTVFLVDGQGMLVDLVDLREFARMHCAEPLPAPSPASYSPHCLATLHGGHICLVLTPNGEIKVFAGGVQVFNFLEGRWRLTDLVEKYREFHKAVGVKALAERLLTTALNLSEERRGGLFVILDDPGAACKLVAPEDLLDHTGPAGSGKRQIHFLLRDKNVLTMDLSVLQSIARVDGGIVLDRTGRLLAFGAILRNAGVNLTAQDGGRTTAAVHASRFGPLLKISEDGLVSYYRDAHKLWEI